ncbi:MAG: right-handed parallel beta-helix repeat-containing protein, partial [Candidatus Omnitrophica bacterium]|nr:right-handed parallel beta-helix repeat-containing protein [Candidatus Omnitrophota bacterium]
MEAVVNSPKRIIYVSQSGNGMGGRTWETAFPTIQEAMDTASSKDHIWVREGEYREAVRLSANIALLGGFSGTQNPDNLDARDTLMHPTIINANDRAEPVITGATYCVLDGLTLTGGKTGLYCKNVVMKVTGCVIVGNENRESALAPSYTDTRPLIAIAQGGGIHCTNSTLWVSNTQILGNLCLAEITGGNQLGVRICLAEGGGLYSEDSDVRIEHCDIDGNRIQSEVSSIYYRCQGNGAGIAGRGSSRFQINRCRIENHSTDTHQSRFEVANLRGGGCYFGDQSIATIDQMSVCGNKILAKWPYHSSFLGGGVAVEGSAKVKISNSLVADNEIFLDPLSPRDVVNKDLFRGGGFFLGGSARLLMENCTVAGNDAPEVDGEGAGIFFDGESLSITNSIVWNGTSSIVQSGSGELSASFSIIDGTIGGEAVLHTNPLFEKPSQGDYRIALNSRAIDSGTATQSAFDLEGATREIDIPGVGADLPSAVVDMGAIEYSPEGNLPLTPTRTPSPTFTQTNTPTPTSTPTPGFRSWYVSSSLPISGDGESWDSPFRTVG